MYLRVSYVDQKYRESGKKRLDFGGLGPIFKVAK